MWFSSIVMASAQEAVWPGLRPPLAEIDRPVTLRKHWTFTWVFIAFGRLSGSFLTETLNKFCFQRFRSHVWRVIDGVGVLERTELRTRRSEWPRGSPDLLFQVGLWGLVLFASVQSKLNNLPILTDFSVLPNSLGAWSRRWHFAEVGGPKAPNDFIEKFFNWLAFFYYALGFQFLDCASHKVLSSFLWTCSVDEMFYNLQTLGSLLSCSYRRIASWGFLINLFII